MKKLMTLSLLAMMILPATSHANLYLYRVRKTALSPDIKVAIVPSFAECTIKFVDHLADYKVQEVKMLEDVSVMQTSALFADVTVKEVTGYADVTVSGTKDLILAAAACPQVRR